MNAWIKRAALALVCAFVLCACTGSPVPEEISATPEPPAPTETPTLIPAPSQEAPSDRPEETPEPVSEAPPIWPPNEGVGLSVTTWNDSVKNGLNVSMTADISLPTFTGVPDAVAHYYAAVLEDFQRRARTYMNEAGDQGNILRPYSLTQNFVVECNHAGFISVRRAEDADLGGMHGETTVYGDTFRVSDGKALLLDDFFTVPPEQYRPALLAEITEQLNAQSENMFADWQETAESYLPVVEYSISPDGLSLYYPEQSLAAYALGVVRVDIKWGSMDVLRKLPEQQG